MPFRTLSGLALLTFGLSACSLGQIASGQVEFTGQGGNPPNATGKVYTVTGTVFNSVTNEPIRRALVQMQGPKMDAAFTGADGRFEFADVPAGRVNISAQRPGFFDPANGAGSGGLVTIGPGSSFAVSSSGNDFRIPLMPEAKLTGTVLDRDGEPIPNLSVELITAQIVQGRKRWVNGMSGMTDDSGVYLFDSQVPGPVLVVTRSPLQNRRDTETFAPRFFPDSPDRAGAQVLNLAAGQEEHADFTLAATAGFSISGTVHGGPPGSSNMGLAFWLNNGGVRSSVGFVQYARQAGTFTIRMVPAGTWDFHFQMGGSDGKVYETEREVTVAGSNVKGVDLTLEPGVDIPLQMNSPAAEGAAGQSSGIFAQVHLLPAGDDSGDEYYATPEGDTNGSVGQPRLVFRNVRPGRYIPVFGQGSGCLGSFTYGSTDATSQPLVVNAGEPAQTLTVNVRNRDCAELSVTLHGDDPQASAQVIVVPESGLVEARVLSGGVNTPLTSENLTPGAYHVYAVSKADGLEYMNPEAMRGFPSQQVTLEAGQKTAVTLEVPANSGH